MLCVHFTKQHYYWFHGAKPLNCRNLWTKAAKSWWIQEAQLWAWVIRQSLCGRKYS